MVVGESVHLSLSVCDNGIKTRTSHSQSSLCYRVPIMALYLSTFFFFICKRLWRSAHRVKGHSWKCKPARSEDPCWCPRMLMMLGTSWTLICRAASWDILRSYERKVDAPFSIVCSFIFYILTFLFFILNTYLDVFGNYSWQCSSLPL